MFQSNRYKFLLAVIALTLLFTNASSAPGDLDPTFNMTGFTKTRLGDSDEQIGATAIQTDGKIIVAGYAFDGAKLDFAVARYNADGSLDVTFDTDGKVLTSIGTGNDSANAIAIQTNGKIVVAGSSNGDFAVVRYNADGSLDTSFDFDGKVTTPIGTANDLAYSAIIQTDGKIVVSGSSRIGSNDNFAVVRYNADGSLDTTFGTTGKIVTQVGVSACTARSAIIQTDGKIVLAGYAFNGANYDFAAVRYNADGSLDTTFGTNGKVITPIGAGNEFAYSVALQADGRIIAAGSSSNGSNDDFAVVRYNADGSLDTAFGTNGRVVTPIGTGNDIAYSVAIQTNGKIVAAGVSFNSNNDFAVVRYNANGSLDTSFDTDGKLTTPIQTSFDYANSVVVQADGKIIAAGVSNNGVNNDFATVRYNTDGSLDTTFDGDGKLITRELGSNASLQAIAIQADGKIVAVGNAYNGTYDFAVVRYNSNGSLDMSFGVAGKTITPFSTTADDGAASVAIQADGKIVVAGFTSNATSDFAVARYNTDGSLDTSFDFDGKVTTAIGASSDEALSVAIQADGKIIAAGHSIGANADFAVVRYNSDGSLDAFFGGSGKVTTPIGTGHDFGRSVKIQSNGKIVLAGESYNGANKDFAVVRYNTDGGLDTTFDTDGKVTTPIGTANDSAYSAAIQADGKIVVAGSSANTGADSGFAVVRYNADGSLDSSFDTDGKVVTQIGSNTDYVNSVAIQTDGKIVAAGANFIDSVTYDYSLVRYNANGSLDGSFGTGGIVKTDLSKVDTIGSAAIQSDGKIVLGGTSGSQFTVVRYLNRFLFEADVSQRPDGNGIVDSDDIQQIRRFSVGLDKPYQGNEGQRADCSPLSTSGNGVIDSDDIQQVRRFSVGLDGGIPLASGPTSVARPTFADASPFADNQPEFTSEYNSAGGGGALRIGNAANNFGQRVTVPIYIDSSGAETGYTFSLDYDSAKLTNPVVGIGTAGGNVVVNTADAGVIGFSVTSFASADGTIAALADATLVNVTFTVATDAGAGATNLIFSDGAAHRRVSGIDPNAPLVQPTYADGTITITTPTPTWTSLAGRVVTPTGRGLMNVTVTLTDANGNTRATRTNSFGYYRFDNIRAGETYIITARSKRFAFSQSSQVLNINEDHGDINFIESSNVSR